MENLYVCDTTSCYKNYVKVKKSPCSLLPNSKYYFLDKFEKYFTGEAVERRP